MSSASYQRQLTHILQSLQHTSVQYTAQFHVYESIWYMHHTYTKTDIRGKTISLMHICKWHCRKRNAKHEYS